MFQSVQEISSLSVVVLGGGVTGRSAVEFLKKHSAKVILLDKNPDLNLGINSFSDTIDPKSLPKIDLVIKSPGIYPSHPFLSYTNENKIKVLSEIEFARNFFKGKTIGITGTDGKSTTTALTEFLIKTKYPNSKMGGNIGISFCEFCTEPLDYAILELSSYQLDDSNELNLDESAILNVAYDHLERHKTMENYFYAKKKILSNSTNHISVVSESIKNSLLNSDSYDCKILTFGSLKTSDAFIDLSSQRIHTKNFSYDYTPFPLVGYHNLENLAASILLSESAGCDPSAMQSSLVNFKGLPFRFEFVKKIGSTVFINDSKSTNLNSMLSGLKGVSSNEKIILIVGGKPKLEPIDSLLKRLSELNVQVFLIGEAVASWQDSLKKQLDANLFVTYNLDSTIAKIKELLQKENFDKVIFSPGCASFDQYKNFEERGRHFVDLVNHIA